MKECRIWAKARMGLRWNVRQKAILRWWERKMLEIDKGRRWKKMSRGLKWGSRSDGWKKDWNEKTKVGHF